MGRRESYVPYQFCWVDLMSHGLMEAHDFYCELFGWTAEEQDTNNGPPYYIFKKDGHDIAGLGEMTGEMREGGAPPHWNSYVHTPDLDAVLAKVPEAGGKVTMPAMQVMTAGEMAVIADPEGAMVALWKPIDHPGSGWVNDANTWGWNELISRDIEASQAFYSKVFGWTFDEDESMTDYVIIKNGEQMNGGILPWRQEMGEIPSFWSVYFTVEDIEKATAKISELGGNLIQPVMDLPVGKLGVVADCQGAMFNIIQMNGPVDD